MNRKQRRSLLKAKPKRNASQNATTISAANAQDYVDNLPLPSIVAGINNLLGQLEARGVSVHDWDAPERKLYRLQTRRGKIYFLAADLDEADRGREKDKLI